MPKKRKKLDYYDGSSYTATVDSRLEQNWGYERDQRFTKFRDKPVPSSKKKKKVRAKLVE